MCTKIPVCMTVEEIRHVMQADDHLNAQTGYVINGWPSVRKEVKERIHSSYRWDNAEGPMSSYTSTTWV